MNRFRYYYEIAEEIITSSSNSLFEAEAPPAAPEAPPPPTDTTPTGDPTVAPSPTNAEPQKINSDVKSKVDKTKLININSDTANEELLSSIDELITNVFEKNEKVKTIKGIIKFLDDIDYTNPKKYDNLFEFKKINKFLTSAEYAKISPTNLYAVYNALNESYILLKQKYTQENNKNKLNDLESIYQKMSSANFMRNLDSINEKLINIKKNLNNINQIFSLQGYDKFLSKTKDMIKMVQKNSTEFIKKLS